MFALSIVQRTVRPATSKLRPSSITSVKYQAPRYLHATPLFRIKEDADRSGSEIEQKKQEQLKAQEQGEGKWHEELASAGESNVKADKEGVSDHDKHMEKLQEETAGQAEKGKI